MDGENDTQNAPAESTEQSAKAETQVAKDAGAEGDVSAESEEDAGDAEGEAESTAV